jgi:hypothetical protein
LIGKASQLDLSTGDHLPPSATRTNEESRHFPAPHKAAPSVHKVNLLPTRQPARFQVVALSRPSYLPFSVIDPMTDVVVVAFISLHSGIEV